MKSSLLLLSRYACPTTRSASFGVSSALELLLADIGCLAPNTVQAAALPPALSGTSTVVVAQTGSGKTLAFLLPILERLSADPSRTAMVLAPSVELVHQHSRVLNSLASKDVADRVVLAATAIPSAGSGGSADDDGSSKASAAAAAAAAATLPPPHVFADASILAVDEIDAVLLGSAYDESFSPIGAEIMQRYFETERTGGGIDDGNEKAAADGDAGASLRQLIGTTAHLSAAHDAALRRSLPAAVFIGQGAAGGSGGHLAGVLVPTLRQTFYYFGGDKKDAKLLRALEVAEEEEELRRRRHAAAVADDDSSEEKDHGEGLDDGEDPSTLVFCGTVQETERVGHLLRAARPALSPLVLHEAMDPQRRVEICEEFRVGRDTVPGAGCSSHTSSSGRGDGSSRLMVCTAVAARGLDFPRVRHVVMYDLPTDAATYVHCVGRTARRGEPGLATSLVKTGGGVGVFKHLHALQDAAKLHFQSAS